MNLQTLSAHTIDLDLLPDSPLVLDVGCRNWDFTDDVLRFRHKAKIKGLDPGLDVKPHHNESQVTFLNCALVGDQRKQSWYRSFSTGEANHLTTDKTPRAGQALYQVQCVNIAQLLAPSLVWDVVKLDCEGSEFEILGNWPGPIARQISIEFHDWENRIKYPDHYFEFLFNQLARFGYGVVQHELSKQGDGVGHWDSLLVLKS